MVEVAKVHGVAVCGSTGEGHTLTTAETRRITEIVVKEAKGRIPVITGIITDSTASAIERGLAVKDLGVAALQITPPHYLFRPDDDTMLKHFEALAKGTGLPIMIYNVVPWCYLSPQLLTRIIDNVEGVIGVKQSAGDMKMLADLIILLGSRGRIMSAVDALMYPSFVLGAHGAIAAILSAVPTLYVETVGRRPEAGITSTASGAPREAPAALERHLHRQPAGQREVLHGADGAARRPAPVAHAAHQRGAETAHPGGAAGNRPAVGGTGKTAAAGKEQPERVKTARKVWKII